MSYISFITYGMLVGTLAGFFAMPFIPWHGPQLLYLPTVGAIFGVAIGFLTNILAKRGIDK